MDRTGVIGGRLAVRVCDWVDGKHLVVAERVDGVVGQESGTVDRAVVDHLQQHVVLVGDSRVVDVDKPVGAPGEQDMSAGGVELKLYGR